MAGIRMERASGRKRMRVMIRIVSGFFLGAVGTGFCLEAGHLDGMLLKAVFAVPGVCSIALGLFLLVKNPWKGRAP